MTQLITTNNQVTRRPEVRERRFILIAGAPGAGKSVFVNDNIIAPYTGNVIIFKHPANIDDKAVAWLPEKTPSNWRQGAKPGAPVRCKMAVTKQDYKKTLQWVADEYRNGLLIVDDATIYEKFILTNEMEFLVIMRRHLGIDIVMMYHGLTRLPIDQFISANYLLLFNTTDNFDYKAKKLPQHKTLQDAAQSARGAFLRWPEHDPRRHQPVILKFPLLP
jgi:hypothetical protein